MKLPFAPQKLTVGGAPEKIVSAFHLVLSEQPNEDSEMSKCNSAVSHVRKLEKDVENACSNRTTLSINIVKSSLVINYRSS